MKNRIKYLITIAGLILIPIVWELPSPRAKFFGMGLITLLGFGWLFYRTRKGGNFKTPKFLIFITAHFLLQVILFSNSPANINGTYSFIFRLYILAFFILIVDHINNPEKRRFWENVLIATGVIYASVDLIYVLTWYSNWWSINGSLFPLPTTLLRSPGILFGHPNLYSGYLSFVTPFALVKVLNARVRSARIFWFEILLILLVANFFTFSRGGWLSLAFALPTTLILYYHHLFSRNLIECIRSKFGYLGKFRFIGLILLFAVMIGAGYLIVTVMRSTPHGTVSARLDIYLYAIRWISTSPLIGHGIGSVPGIFALRGYAIGGDERYHSHNTWLEISLESGILGFLLVLAALGSILWAFRSAWNKWHDDRVELSGLAAYAGAGIAFLVHSFFDYHLWEASYILAIGIMLALVFSLAEKKHFIFLRQRYIVPAIALLILIGFGLLVYINRNHPLYLEGKASASDGNWVSARDQICEAAELNSRNTLYAFQCSLAYAYEAKLTRDQNHLEAAYQYQERALELDPDWYIHWANLASYEWQLGDSETAIDHMQKAFEMAPNRTFLLATLARMHEIEGNDELANEHFKNVNCRNPAYQDVPDFQESSIFKLVVQEGCPEIKRRAFMNKIWSGKQALENGDLIAAEDYFQSAIPLNVEDGTPYAFLALVHHESGEFDQSERDIQTAFLIDSSSAQNHEIAARIAFADGKIEEGNNHLFEAFLLRRMIPFSYDYYAYRYFDTGLPSSISPYIPMLISRDSVELYKELANHLANQGEDDKYRQVTQWLQIIESP